MIKTEENGWHHAIADKPIDAKVDGTKTFCVRVDEAKSNPALMIGCTPLETFNANDPASFGNRGFDGFGSNNFVIGSLIA